MKFKLVENLADDADLNMIKSLGLDKEELAALFGVVEIGGKYYKANEKGQPVNDEGQVINPMTGEVLESEYDEEGYEKIDQKSKEEQKEREDKLKADDEWVSSYGEDEKRLLKPAEEDLAFIIKALLKNGLGEDGVIKLLEFIEKARSLPTDSSIYDYGCSSILSPFFKGGLGNNSANAEKNEQSGTQFYNKMVALGKVVENSGNENVQKIIGFLDELLTWLQSSGIASSVLKIKALGKNAKNSDKYVKAGTELDSIRSKAGIDIPLFSGAIGQSLPGSKFLRNTANMSLEDVLDFIVNKGITTDRLELGQNAVDATRSKKLKDIDSELLERVRKAINKKYNLMLS